jgi:hypothetical protein
MTLTIVYITSRPEPKIEWFWDSLHRQPGKVEEVIIVDLRRNERQGPLWDHIRRHAMHVLPKPTVWQGQHRLTKSDWWAIANARNTGVCLCKTDWIAFVDDRSVMLQTWLPAVREAMKGEYAVAGSYEKRYNMTVKDGVIIERGTLDGSDPRMPRGGCNYARPIAGGEFFGCTSALPLEWVLKVNGFDETCDSLGMEDVLFGCMLQNNMLQTRYDCRMKIVEDRTPSEIGPVITRTDKGVSPNDKSHGLKARLENLKRASHAWDIRDIRNRVLAGEPFPIPTGPTADWWDNQPISELA